MFVCHREKQLAGRFCKQLIAMAEHEGFEQSKVGEAQVLDTSIRNNSRYMFTDKYLADLVLHTIWLDIPKYTDMEFSNVGDFFRIYKYEPVQYFKTHKDGDVEIDNTVSMVTVLIYLNDTIGGETVLMPYGKGQEWAHKKYAPQEGSLLMFDHNTWHSGEPVTEGIKYVLRTDLFYTCNSPVGTV